MNDLAAERRQMVERQIARRGLCEPRLLAAFEEVPRHLFVPQQWRAHAYRDCALPIGLGQTISQTYIVALMTDLLCLMGSENVLEVGTGSGYQAAILSRLAARVQTIEYDPQLARRAKALLGSLCYQNVYFREGDGASGWPEAAPFDGILVTAFAPQVPPPLLEQLSEGGRLIMPVGTCGLQTLESWTRTGNRFERQRIVGVAFVPLRGEYGWKE
jgi:protein-L-isoaspartate(D-aspartate) O-methyltransferase